MQMAIETCSRSTFLFILYSEIQTDAIPLTFSLGFFSVFPNLHVLFLQARTVPCATEVSSIVLYADDEI